MVDVLDNVTITLTVLDESNLCKLNIIFIHTFLYYLNDSASRHGKALSWGSGGIFLLFILSLYLEWYEYERRKTLVPKIYFCYIIIHCCKMCFSLEFCNLCKALKAGFSRLLLGFVSFVILY